MSSMYRIARAAGQTRERRARCRVVGAVARIDAARGRALCIRCCVWALFAVLAVFIVGGVAGYMTRAAAPMWGSMLAGVLLIGLVGLAARQRVLLQVRAAR